MTQYSRPSARTRGLLASILSMALFTLSGVGQDQTASPPEAVLQAYESRDVDGSGHLTRDEFVAGGKGDPEVLGREFHVVDFDGDGRLTLVEFQCAPSAVPRQHRGPLPDPVVALVDSRRSELEAKWPEWDTDENGAISPGEFSAALFGLPTVGLDRLGFKDWDADHDGEVSQADALWVLEIAYGVRRPEGDRLRRPTGEVIDWRSFNALAKGGSVSKERYLETRKAIGVPDAEQRFSDLDKNSDEQLSFEEWAESSALWSNQLDAFMRLDTSLSGRLEADELDNAKLPSGQKPWTHGLIPAFDSDADEALSLYEYRLTPLANSLAVWHGAKDRDGDGKLQLEEFRFSDGAALRALTAEFFSRLDRNQDDALDRSEWVFSSKHRDTLFLSCDQNADEQLSISEFLTVGLGRPETLRRNFQVMDFNADNTLSKAEFSFVPGLSGRHAPNVFPDRVAAIVDQEHRRVTENWTTWDRNGDHTISADEFTAFVAALSNPGLKLMPLEQWDQNGDRVIAPDEIRRSLDVAYGVRSPNGVHLRKSTGDVLDCRLFRVLDLNADGFVEKPDYLKHSSTRTRTDPDAWFDEIDTDRDGRMSLEEWAGSRQFWGDSLARFLQLDDNVSGHVEREELLNARLPSGQKALVPWILPGFDRDGDGALSLAEYQFTPLANLFAVWNGAADQDQDGALSREEFRFSGGPFLAGLSADYFDHLDLDRNDLLSVDEWTFHTRHPKVQFSQRDSDQDGMLTEAEFVSAGARSPEALTRDFRVVDFDEDGKLTLDEFATVPALVPRTLRGKLPDPVNDLVVRHHQTMTEQWDGWDQDDDARLSRSEFSSSMLSRTVGGMELIGFQTWDCNADGALTLDEARTTLEIAFGIRRPEGELVRTESGDVADWRTFSALDRDRDGMIEKSDYLRSAPGRDAQDPDQSFRRLDSDADGRLSFQEWFAGSAGWAPSLERFLSLDTNLDGHVEKQELMTARLPAGQLAMAEYLLPAFDHDRDGKLSFREYRLTPLANLLANWPAARDEDHDGRLSMSEFRFDDGPALAALTAVYFDRLDRNDDGRLELDEWPIQVDFARAPRPVVLKIKDQDGDRRLSVDELLGNVPRPKPGEKVDVAQETRIVRVEEAFRRADQNGDGLLDLAELSTDAGREALSPGASSIKSRTAGRRGRVIEADDDETDLRMYLLIGFNILLVVGVVWFLLMKPKNS